jgi:hypothetical protein
MLKFPFGKQPSPEIRDKSDISCLGLNLEVPEESELPTQPIKSSQPLPPIELSPDVNLQAKSFILTVSGGELEQTYVDERFEKVETIKRGRGLAIFTPLHHDKNYDVGFLIESIPSKDRTPMYQFLSNYLNPGKAPEPYDVSIDTIQNDGDILHRIKYTNCDAVDFSWYMQDANFFYQFSNTKQQEIRERYINYCEGLRIEFP